MRDGELDGQDQESKGQKPPVFSAKASLKLYRPVFRILKPRVALSIAGWQPYTSRTVKRGVGPRVTRCERMWKSPWDWVRKG